MKYLFGSAVIVACSPAMAMALGLDRSTQPVDIIFEEGNYAQFSYGRVFPDASGEDSRLALPDGTVIVPGGGRSGDVIEDFNQFGAAIKYQITERFSGSLILDEPYGLDLAYPGDGLLSFGGTYANVDSYGVSAIGRYVFDNDFSVHAGLRYQSIEALVGLSGAAVAGLDGYRAEFDRDWDLGYIVGAAYERPEIALRVALTYISGTDHRLDTRETVNGIGADLLTGGALSASSVTEIETPDAVHLDLQTGIAPDTLLFGSVRYAWYGDTIVSPVFYDLANEPERQNTSLTEIRDGAAYTLGLARQFNDVLGGSIAVGYEPEDDDDLVSPLSPVNGNTSVALGLSYAVNDALTVSGGASYVWLGDARPETGTPDIERARFTDNDTVGFGLRIGYRF